MSRLEGLGARWIDSDRDGTHVWLRDTTAQGAYLDIRHNDDPKTSKLRVHQNTALTP